MRRAEQTMNRELNRLAQEMMDLREAYKQHRRDHYINRRVRITNGRGTQMTGTVVGINDQEYMAWPYVLVACDAEFHYGGGDGAPEHQLCNRCHSRSR